jgi:hypothetical protein
VKQQHTSTATSILTTKSTYRSLSAQRLSERTVLGMWRIKSNPYFIFFANSLLQVSYLQISSSDCLVLPSLTTSYNRGTKIISCQFITTEGTALCKAVYGVGLRPPACGDCLFESRRRLDVCLLWLLCVVSANSWSLVQRSPTYCGVLSVNNS